MSHAAMTVLLTSPQPCLQSVSKDAQQAAAAVGDAAVPLADKAAQQAEYFAHRVSFTSCHPTAGTAAACCCRRGVALQPCPHAIQRVAQAGFRPLEALQEAFQRRLYGTVAKCPLR